MRVAVIGSGAAAAGVLAGLERWARPGTDVTVFDIGQRLPGPNGNMAAIYRRLHAEHGLSFPPPKSHFGHTLSKLAVDGRPAL